MEIRQLRYFMQVCESGSLLKASEVLFISRQALSKSLSLLEKELGAALFYRTPKGMIPTQFGQELLEDSRPILAEWDQLNLKLEESATRHKGKIRLGLSGGLIYFGSKKIWEYFKELHPHTEIEPYEHGYIEGLKCLKAGTLDAVVISDYENTDDKLCSEDGLCGLCIDSNTSNLIPKYPELRAIPFKDYAFPYPMMLAVRNNYPKPTLIKELVDFLTYSLNSVLY